MQKRSLPLLLLSILLIPAPSAPQGKEEGLELPEVYIYGTHLGKIQLSPKKDFFPYLSMGDLYPHSRPSSPELHIPLHRSIPYEASPLQRYWLLLDAGAGNWWSDKVFLDCGLRNRQGLLSLRFSDFRRKNWVQDHGRTDDYVRLKGAFGQDIYYLSGTAFYGYGKMIKGAFSPADTAENAEGGAELLTRLDLYPLEVSVLGKVMLYSRTPMYISGQGNPVELKEHDYGISAHATFFQDFFDALADFGLENVTSDAAGSGYANTVTNSRFFLKKTFSHVALAPGIAVITDREQVTLSPAAMVQLSLPAYPVCVFLNYLEKHSVNTYRDMFSRFAFVSVPISRYQVLETRSMVAGAEGKWRWLGFYGAYKHEEHEQYPVLPLMPVASGVLFSGIKKDEIELVLECHLKDFDLFAGGVSGFHEKVPHEPTTVLRAGGTYGGFEPLTLFTDIEASFDIQTAANRKVDIFSLNGGIAYRLNSTIALKLEAENIFDQRYEVWPGYTEGGIQFYASLKYKVLQ